MNFKHGHNKASERSAEYRAWTHLKSRCYDMNDKSYNDYGGRGIKVCDEWLHSFQLFLRDMGRKPSIEYSIDRINTNGNYEPQNCRWGTPHEQANNKRNNVLITFNGETKTLNEWSRSIGVERRTISRRLFILNWSIYDTLTIPVKKNISFNGMSKNLTEWSAFTGIGIKILSQRIKSGMPLSKALIIGSKFKFINHSFGVNNGITKPPKAD